MSSSCCLCEKVPVHGDPGSLPEQDHSYIFHVKMAYYKTECFLRPGRFSVCQHHQDWNDDADWLAFKMHIQNHPELLSEGEISIDVDELPHPMQITVSKIAQLPIFNWRSPTNQQAGTSTLTEHSNTSEPQFTFS